MFSASPAMMCVCACACEHVRVSMCMCIRVSPMAEASPQDSCIQPRLGSKGDTESPGPCELPVYPEHKADGREGQGRVTRCKAYGRQELKNFSAQSPNHSLPSPVSDRLREPPSFSTRQKQGARKHIQKDISKTLTVFFGS